jgi:hypothetical protein
VELFGQEITEWCGFNLRVQCSGVSNLSCLQRDTTLLGFNNDKTSDSLHDRHISMN